jgi:hypothetical protein
LRFEFTPIKELLVLAPMNPFDELDRLFIPMLEFPMPVPLVPRPIEPMPMLFEFVPRPEDPNPMLLEPMPMLPRLLDPKLLMPVLRELLLPNACA